MDERRFWQLIDESREAAPNDPYAQSQALEALLTGRTREELEQFETIYRTLHWRAYSWDCWAVGWLLAGGMSDDAFEYFRDWLISRGERIYRMALEQPEDLVDVIAPDDELTAEDLASAASDAYRDTYRERMPRLRGVGASAELEGERWDEDDLEARFPRLWQRMIDG